MPKKIVLLLVFCCLHTFLFAQPLPKSNVYLFEMQRVSDSIYQFNNPQYLTQFNPRGYNNQPAFFSNSEMYLSVQTPQQMQPDLFFLDLDRKTRTRVTDTPEGEFSPQRMPDQYNFSAVRQEISGRDTVQRLWMFPVDRLTNGKPAFKYLEGVGYHQWINSYQVAVFMVDNPSYLGIADTRTDEVIPIATNPGRCFAKMPNGSLAYVQKGANGNWLLMERNLYRANSQPVKLINTLPGSEDFAVMPDGTIIMGNGSRLYKFDRSKDTEWIEIADFRFYDIRNISRLAISNDMKIAVVAD